MERPRMRPLFKLVLPVEAEGLIAEIGRRVRVPDSRYAGTIHRRHVELTIQGDERHFWSPHLSLDVFADGGQTNLRGRYAPHPSIWTFIMSLYFVLMMLAIASAVYGFSQLTLGWQPWAFAGIPVCVVFAVATWIASAVGQKLALPQMHELQGFFEDCVRRVSDPPPGGQAASAAPHPPEGPTTPGAPTT